MTSGFDHIKDSLSRALRRPPKLEVSLDEDSLGMLREMTKGQEYDVEELASRLLTQIISERYQATDENIRHWESLSRRQQEVAALACLGYSNAEIAEKLHISPETVKTHMSEILRKFNVRGRHQLRHILRRWDFHSFDK